MTVNLFVFFKDGESGLPQEVISQLLEEAIEIETQSKKSDDGR